MDNAYQILNECHESFCETDSARILSLYRSRDNRLTFDERLFIIKEIQKVYCPVLMELQHVSPSLTDWDHLLCILSYEGISVSVIAECFSVSNDAVRMRKSRLREKLPAEWFALFFHITLTDEKQCHNSVTDNPSIANNASLPLAQENDKMPKAMDDNIPVKMTFVKAIANGLTGTFRFKGRSSRAEFWYYTLFCLIMFLVLTVVMFISQKRYDNIATIVWFSASVIVAFSHSAAAVRRIHDTERSAWLWCVTYLLPWLTFITISVWHIEYDVHLRNMVGGSPDPFIMSWYGGILGINLTIIIVTNILTVIWYCSKGTEGPNYFGPDPLYRNNSK